MAEATAVSFRKGSSVEHQTFRGVKGEITVDTTDLTVWVHPGSNEIGNPLARADMANVTQANIAARNIAKDDLSNIALTTSSLSHARTQLQVPTKTSELENDSGFITAASSIGNGKLILQKNGTTVSEAFTANTFDPVTVNITVPTNTNELTNGSGFITNAVNNLTNYTKTTDLASVAISGSYSDLSNKPNLAAVATSGSYNDLLNKPALKTVATTGSYNDLLNKPTIPAAQIQSDWSVTDQTSKAYICSKPILIVDVVVTSGTGVINLELDSSFDTTGGNTPTVKQLIGGTVIAGTWAAVSGTDYKEWTFTPTTATDILTGSWIIVL